MSASSRDETWKTQAIEEGLQGPHIDIFRAFRCARVFQDILDFPKVTSIIISSRSEEISLARPCETADLLRVHLDFCQKLHMAIPTMDVNLLLAHPFN